MSFRSELLARVLLATRVLDRAHHVFDRARSELVSALASDETLDRFTELAYGSRDTYTAGSEGFRRYLFPWEEDVVARFFPDPPARVLVGGAGGGREVFALARLGYEVVAFEPSAPLVRSLAEEAPAGTSVRAYRAAYEDLPRLEPALEAEAPADLAGLGPFAAAVFGWGSFSHLRSDTTRLAALRAFAAVTDGPIVVSFVALKGPHGQRFGRLRDRLPYRPGRSRDDMFSVYIGFFHRTDEAEVRRLADAAGLDVVHSLFDERDTNWPHVVLRRREPAR